ncbi:hypothetical protein VTO42DRAFT_4380 [Malbranchea cinnamomea]
MDNLVLVASLRWYVGSLTTMKVSTKFHWEDHGPPLRKFTYPTISRRCPPLDVEATRRHTQGEEKKFTSKANGNPQGNQLAIHGYG